MNGSSPSSTSMSANAMKRGFPIDAPLLRSALARISQVLEEIGGRLEDEDVAALVEARLVRVQAAVERIELRVLAEGFAVHGGGALIALAFHCLRLLVGIGDDDLALAIRLGADLFRLRE